jgi:hypothetical protein
VEDEGIEIDKTIRIILEDSIVQDEMRIKQSLKEGEYQANLSEFLKKDPIVAN